MTDGHLCGRGGGADERMSGQWGRPVPGVR